MINNNIYLDEEGNIHDYVNLIHNIGYSTKPTRKRIKQDAIKLANTDNGDDVTNKDYLQGNVVINTNKRKQRLFDRTFYKQYNKRINKTIDDALLNAASNGNVEANQELIRRKTNRVAPYFIPAVAGPAAMYAATNGLFTLAGTGMAKGLHTIGNGMMPSTYMKALNIGSKYPILPTTLDALANSAYIGAGLNHAKKLYDNEEYEAAAATGLLSGLPLVHTILNGAKGLSFTNNSHNISKNNDKLTKVYNKYLKPIINTKKARTDLYNRYRSAIDANSKMETADLRRYNEFNEALNNDYFSNVAIKVPTTKIKQPITETINTISHDTNLPIKGINRKITTTNIEEITSPENFEILDPNSKSNSIITAFDVGTGISPIGMVRGLKQSNGKYLLRAGNPSTDEIQAFDEYRKAISETIGSDGAITGSTRLYGKYLSGEPNDLEILTTRSKLNNLQHKLNFSKKQELPLAIEGRSIIDNSQIKTDIQIIDDSNGFATGDIANSIYTVLHPEKLAEIHKAKAGFDKIFYPKADGSYYTADEMLNEVMSKDLLDKVILVDALKVSKNYNINPVKQNRPVTLLSNDNPNTIKDIKDALKILGEAQVGKEYKSFNQLYNVDFTNISANKEFLKAIGFPEKLATNPEIMKNIAEYYHMQKSLSVRNINSIKAGSNLDDAITTTTSRSGTGSGGGGNSVNATHAKVVTHYGDISTISQYDIVPDKSKIKTLYDYYKQVKRLDRYTDLTPDQINKIKANPDYAGKTYKKVKDVHERSGYINTPSNAEFVANELDLPIIFYPNEGAVSNYVGRYSKKPLTYTTKSSKSALYEFGRPIEEYYSANSTKTRINYHDTKEQEFAEKIAKLLNSKDKHALKQLGVEAYTEKELNDLFNMISDRYNKNSKILNNIYHKSLDKLNKISNIKESLNNALLYGTGIGAVTASGIHFLGPTLEKQRQQDAENLNYFYDFYKKYYEASKNENATEIDKENFEKLKNSVSKRAWKSFENRYKIENNVDKKRMGGKQNNQLQIKNGIAQPLGKGYYLMNGPSHEQGGIDIGENLEVEGGEVVKINPKSIKVVTAQKIMGGKSPAELVVNASSTGEQDKVFNKVFKYQEDFKDRHNLNDDGTSKAKFGKEKSIDEMNSEMLFLPTKKENIDQNKNTLVYKTYPKNYVEVPRRINIEKDLVAGLHDITNDIIEGKYSLYQNHSYHKNRFLKDKQTGKIYEDVFSDIDPIDLSYFDITPYSEIRKMLPKRDYIGGSKREVGIKVINKVPGLKDEILKLSKVYGISPNVFTNRLINEGWVQQIAHGYNIASPKDQKEYKWDRMNDFVNGFNSLGLDTFGNHHKAGHLNLRRDIKYDDRFTTNEDGTGRVYNSAAFDNMYDALEAKAAMIEYLTKLGKNKGHSGSDLDAWVNAAYNMGEYHKDLNNMNYVRQKYGVKPFYRYGGEMKNKKKANLGIFNPNAYLWQPEIEPAKVTAQKPTSDKLVKTMNEFGEHYLYKPESQTNSSVVVVDKPKKSFGEQIYSKTRMYQSPGYLIDPKTLPYLKPFWNFNIRESINLNRGDVPIPYKLEEKNVNPVEQIVETKVQTPIQTNSNTTPNTATKAPIVQRITPTPTTPNTATTPNKTTSTSVNQNTTKSNTNYKPRLDTEFLNEIVNPDGSITNFRTGQTYFKDLNKIRRSPYSQLNLKTGQMEYAGYINPYGAEIQPAVYNNGPKGRQEREAKERLLNTGDWINLGLNSAGALTNLITGLATPNIRYARMKDAIPVIAPKINANVNTTAEENAIDEAYYNELNAIDENTANSQTALNRKRNAAARRAAAKVKVRSAAENTRRDLINKGNILKGEYDKFNIQRQDQIDAYNRQADAAEFNANRTKVGDAITGFVSDLGLGASTITNAIEKREADRINTVLSYMGNPEVNPDEFNKGFDDIYEKLYGKKPSNYSRKKYSKR